MQHAQSPYEFYAPLVSLFVLYRVGAECVADNVWIDAKSPWERGTNENTNGLLRQYFPKGTDFSKVSKNKLKKVQEELNDRPRKTLAWDTPHEKFTELLR